MLFLGTLTPSLMDTLGPKPLGRRECVCWIGVGGGAGDWERGEGAVGGPRDQAPFAVGFGFFVAEAVDDLLILKKIQGEKNVKIWFIL